MAKTSAKQNTESAKQTLHNRDIAAAFNEIGDLLELTGANPFRIRAYRNAAERLRDWPDEASEWKAQGHSFDEIPDIGADLADKIDELIKRGRSKQLDELRREKIAGLAGLLHIGGLGSKRLRVLHEALGVCTPKQLLAAVQARRVRELPGFGATSEKRIGEAIGLYLRQSSRRLWCDVKPDADALVEYLRESAAVSKVTVAGSYRRVAATVGDLDIVVTSNKGTAAIRHFAAYPQIARVLAQGSARASVELKDGLQVDLRAVEPEAYGAALVYFTGSREHTVALRGMARSRGLKANEYGVFRGETNLADAAEASVYAALDLSEIPPEMRENRGEILAAQRGELPALIAHGELRGDLHVHTDATDGRGSLAEMVAAARAAGLAYVAITDHSQNLRIGRGLDTTRLARQCEAIDKINTGLRGFRVLKGIEVDILEDGSLDLPNSVLERLDLVVGAVHSALHLPRAKQTDRILRALDNPYFSILAHPTGRLVGERPPCELDMPRIIRHARERGCFLELNAHPKRCDLDDSHCRMAKDEGVLIAVSSDAHHPDDFAQLDFGIGRARRGWLTRADVLNTRSLTDVQRLLARTMGRTMARVR
jgi:DNA polymerase (family 10)